MKCNIKKEEMRKKNKRDKERGVGRERESMELFSSRR